MLPRPEFLGGAFDVSEAHFEPDLPDWIVVLQADPSRWWIGFACRFGGGVLITTEPNDPPTHGFLVPDTGIAELEFSRSGPLVGLQWFARATVARVDLTVFSSSIRRQAGPITRE